MEKKALQCDLCGGRLIMDAGGETAICEGCTMTYTIERLREKLQKVSIEGDINVKGVATEDDLLKNAETYIELGKFAEAKKVYADITEKYPHIAEGWWGLFKLIFVMHPSIDEIINGYENAESAMKLGAYSEKVEDIISQYGFWYDDILQSVYNTNEKLDSDFGVLIRYSVSEIQKIPALYKVRKHVIEELYQAFQNGMLSLSNIPANDLQEILNDTEMEFYNDDTLKALRKIIIEEFIEWSLAGQVRFSQSSISAILHNPEFAVLQQRGKANARKINENGVYSDMMFLNKMTSQSFDEDNMYHVEFQMNNAVVLRYVASILPNNIKDKKDVGTPSYRETTLFLQQIITPEDFATQLETREQWYILTKREERKKVNSENIYDKK